MIGIDRLPKIISHRGLGYRHIENTIPAIKAAVDAKVEMIEIDVYETRDGRFIVYHDDRLEPGTPPWPHLTYAQVRSLTANDDRAPLLSHCIEVSGSIPVDIEIKHCTQIDNLLETLGMSSPVKGSVISSSDYNLLFELHKRGVDFPLILIVSISKRQTIRQNFQNAVLCIVPDLLPKYLGGVGIHHRLVSKTFVNRLKRKGAKVFVWTVDDRDDMEKFVSWSVNGIITNYPHRLQDIRRRRLHVQEVPKPKRYET